MKIEDLLKEAELCYDEDKIEDSIIYLETVLEIDETNLQALLMLCKTYASILQFKKALKYGEIAYKHYSEDLEVIFTLGYLNQELNRNKVALRYYEKYIEKEKSYHVYLNMGMCYMDLNFIKKALDIVEKAIELHPNNTEAYFEKASYYTRKGKYEEALNIYFNEIKDMEDVEEFYLYMKIAETYHKMKDIENAIKYYNIAISCEHVPISVVYDKFYYMLMEEKRYDEVELLILNYANSNFPKKAAINMEWKFAFATDDLERAKSASEKLIMLEPKNPIFYYNFIKVFIKGDKYDEALEVVDKLEKEIGKNSDTEYERKQLKMYKEDYLKSIEKKKRD